MLASLCIKLTGFPFWVGSIVLVLVAAMLSATNVWFIGFYISNKVPGLFAIDASLPRPKDEEYLWEKTAGMGIVPKWVSWIGIAAIAFFIGAFVWLAIWLRPK
jgi:hypothetical protein